ncbi:MAG TPA: tetratricopeptide repeat protein [Bauldia sp.]|mgnify:CR=1 FL=1|nr:tetratricopeptide repeat protein [Bauldia sp.]
MKRGISGSPRRLAALAVGAALTAAVLAGPAMAVSDGGSAPETPTCNKGWVWDAKKQICVRAKADLFDDRTLYEQGRALALAGRYEDALALLELVRDRHDAMVLTMIGYSKRKLGDVDAGLAYYHQALAIDPDNVNTREYLGEGYVSLGRTDLAEVELGRIEAICGTDCEQFRDLATAIEGAGNWR